MGIPSWVSASGWIPFVVILLLALLFSCFTIKYFWNRYDSDRASSVIATLALCVSLLSSLLLPVDIFLVSYMKTPDGNFKDWANNETRQSIEYSTLYAYYSLYGTLFLFAFFLLPLVYFAYEEQDVISHTRSRWCSALKYTMVFVLCAAVLLIIGSFIPLQMPPRNTTEWERIELLAKELKDHGADTLSFVLGVLSLIGMLTLICYTGCGMSVWPVNMVRGSRSTASEYAQVKEERSVTQSRISSIRNKDVSGKRVTSRERALLAELEETERLISKQEYHLDEVHNSCLYKCRYLLRPLQMIAGICGGLLGLLIWISLLWTNIDKLMHSMGYKMGYVLPKSEYPNPLDIVLVKAQQIFPVDYLLFAGIVTYLVVCTISGIRYLGLWFLFIRLYKIRPHRTCPQGLIMLSATLMYTVLAINIMLYGVTPQYTTYGSEHYSFIENGTTVVQPCSTEAPPDNCVMTQAISLLLSFFYKVWFFGVAYYWATWLFLVVALVSFFVAIIKRRHSSIDGLVDKDDFDESDDDLLRP